MWKKLFQKKKRDDKVSESEISAREAILKANQERVRRNSMLLVDEFDSKIENARKSIGACDEKITYLEKSSNKKNLEKAIHHRLSLTKFLDDLIRKQYMVDKTIFDSSLLIPAVPEVEKDFEEEIKAEEKKSKILCQSIGKIAKKFKDPDIEDIGKAKDTEEIEKMPDESDTIIENIEKETNEPDLENEENPEPDSKELTEWLKEADLIKEDTEGLKDAQLNNKELEIEKVPWYLLGTEYDKN